MLNHQTYPAQVAKMRHQNPHKINSLGRGCDSKQRCNIWLVLPYGVGVTLTSGILMNTRTKNTILGGLRGSEGGSARGAVREISKPHTQDIADSQNLGGERNRATPQESDRRGSKG